MFLLICPVCGWYCTVKHSEDEGNPAAHEHPEVWATQPVEVAPVEEAA